MLRGGERSHFLSYLKLLDSQQNAKPDLEQLKLFLLLLKAAINSEALRLRSWCSPFKRSHLPCPRCNLFSKDKFAFDREMLG